MEIKKHMNFEEIKKDFPILNNDLVDDQIVYLDSAATSQKPQQVIDSIKDFYEKYNSNVHRSIHELGESATTFYEQTREKVAKFINALPEEIIFTKGTTEGINFIADAWARHNITQGDQILISQVEHHANFLPWQRVIKEKKGKLKFIKLNKKTFELENVDSENNDLFNSRTKLMAVTHNSNVLGSVWNYKNNQLEKLIENAHKVGAKVLIDAAQGIVIKKIDVKKMNIDFLAFSGHKMLGPTGIGILYIKKELHDKVEPYQVGGSMINFVSWDKVEWRPAPNKFEAGTPPIAQVFGLGHAIDYINKTINFDELKKHMAILSSALIDGLEKIDGIKIWGNIEKIREEGHLVCFSLKGIHAHDLSAYLGKKNISVRSGHHCAQPLAELLGIDASLRVSFYLYNTLKDVEIFLKELNNAIKFFKTELSRQNNSKINKDSFSAFKTSCSTSSCRFVCGTKGCSVFGGKNE